VSDDRDIGSLVKGRYELVRLLGAGASSAVYASRDRSTRRRVALKLLHENLLRSEEHVARFVRESAVAARIRHHNVVEFLGAGLNEDGRPYLVQELLDGEDMAQALRRELLPLQHVYEISLQLLDALAAVHAAGLVHRDVKPANVFLLFGEYGELRVKLVDFGVVKPKQDADRSITGTGDVIGTPHYMSPEQARGLEVDARSDLWSVGVLLYEAICGSLPFDSDDSMRLFAEILVAPVPPLLERRPSLPRWLVDIVNRALERDVDKRYQSAERMSAALRRRRSHLTSRPPYPKL
jgi:eukaryotic-like serine/threonine-protein kinase